MRKINYFKKRALELGIDKAIPVIPEKDIIFDERSRLLCVNNCWNYNNRMSCPPNIPNIDYEKAVKQYKHGLLIVLERDFKNEAEAFRKCKVESTNTLHFILLQLEQEAFNEGYSMATSFIGGSCKLCKECGKKCKQQKLSRIPMEAVGMDVLQTVKKYDIKIKFPAEKYEKLKRVGLFLLE